MKKSSENWLKIAKRDLKVAFDNVEHGNFYVVVEKCHAALEKLLKAIITENDKEPSKVHNLLKLAGEALIENLQEDIQEIFAELNSLFIATRYPDDIDELDHGLTKERVEVLLKETRRIFAWLEQKLK